MDILVDVILRAGRSAVELALFTLLPMMVVMLSLMRLLEARGVIDLIVARLGPLLRPVGLTGLGVFAALQVNFVSFAAPVATLSMMEQRGASDRHLAATLAMVMAMPQANVVMPMTAMGLNYSLTLLTSLLGGLVAAGVTFHIFARNLPSGETLFDQTLHHRVADDTKGVLDTINRAGAEAFKIAVGAIPMLVLALVAVATLDAVGIMAAISAMLAPLLNAAGIDSALVVPTLTKYLGGGTAMMGVIDEMLRHDLLSTRSVNQAAGFLIHPLDIPGIAILASAGPRVASTWPTATLGASVGILIRAVSHAVLA